MGESSRGAALPRVRLYHARRQPSSPTTRPDSALVAARTGGRPRRVGWNGPRRAREIASLEAVGRVLIEAGTLPRGPGGLRARPRSQRRDGRGRHARGSAGRPDDDRDTHGRLRARGLALHPGAAPRRGGAASSGVGTGKSRANVWYPYYLSRVGLLLRQHRNEEAFLALDNARARGLRDLRRRRFSRARPHRPADR